MDEMDTAGAEVHTRRIKWLKGCIEEEEEADLFEICNNKICFYNIISYL